MQYRNQVCTRVCVVCMDVCKIVIVKIGKKIANDNVYIGWTRNEQAGKHRTTSRQAAGCRSSDFSVYFGVVLISV